MSDLVVIVYPTEAKAEEMRTKLFSLQKEYLIELSDAVIAVKQDSGKVKLNQLMNRLKENGGKVILPGGSKDAIKALPEFEYADNQ